jgi:hypothetical protein
LIDNGRDIETAVTDPVTASIEPEHANSVAIDEQGKEIESIDAISSEPQSLEIGGDVAVAAGNAEAAVSTSKLAENNLANGNVYSFVNLPLSAAGKFTVSSAEMIVQLSKRTDDEIDALVKQAGGAESQGVQLSLYGRCSVGACCWERRRRNGEMKKKHFKTIPLESWCKSVGLRSPKSAKRWAENWQTAQDTSAVLTNALVFAGIDLFLPRVAEALRVLNAELAGREPSTFELPILLAWLKERMKKPKNPSPSNQRQDAIVRSGPIPINDDPYTDEILESAESEEELRLYVAAAIKYLALYDPLLRTYVALAASATVEDRAQKLFAFTPVPERELFGQVWSESCRQEAEREAHFQSESDKDAGDSESISH